MEATRMRHTQFRALTMALTVFALVATLVGDSSAGTKVICSFAGGTDGEYIDSDLVIGSGGNIYGTSVQGGEFGGGNVFELTPSGGSWIHSVLYSFTGGLDGGEPYKGVTLD